MLEYMFIAIESVCLNEYKIHRWKQKKKGRMIHSNLPFRIYGGGYINLGAVTKMIPDQILSTIATYIIPARYINLDAVAKMTTRWNFQVVCTYPYVRCVLNAMSMVSITNFKFFPAQTATQQGKTRASANTTTWIQTFMSAKMYVPYLSKELLLAFRITHVLGLSKCISPANSGYH